MYMSHIVLRMTVLLIIISFLFGCRMTPRGNEKTTGFGSREISFECFIDSLNTYASTLKEYSKTAYDNKAFFMADSIEAETIRIIRLCEDGYSLFPLAQEELEYINSAAEQVRFYAKQATIEQSIAYFDKCVIWSDFCLVGLDDLSSSQNSYRNK